MKTIQTVKEPGREPAPDPKAMEKAVGQLCTACGLCCNGALFTDVKLQPSDSPERLAALGLTLERRGRTIRFSQPCCAHGAQGCAIYADRPTHCRAFACRLLLRAEAGEVTPQTALRTIKKARQAVAAVESIINQLGQPDTHLAPSLRYRRLMSQPWELGGDQKSNRLRGQLMNSVHKMAVILEREF